MARNALTAVNAQQRANTIPRLPRAQTGAWGFVKGGKWVWIIVVHSVTRGWQAIGILLGGMGETQSPIQCPTEGSLVPSSMCRPVMYQKPTLESLATPPRTHVMHTPIRSPPPPRSGATGR